MNFEDLTDAGIRWHFKKNFSSGDINHLSGAEFLPIKENTSRKVFLIDKKEQNYYLKVDLAPSVWSRIKNLFRFKVKREFNSSELLESNGINCVDYIAWGKSGNTGYLLSKALENSVNALEYWFETASASQKKKKEFLGSLQGFLKDFHAARFYHPDLHLGNLLFKPDTKTFFIVDPYGIKKTFRISRENQFNIFRILGALRGELDNKEATEILKNAGVADNDKSATELWYRIVEAENSEMEKVWPKRKEKILSGHSKYATVIITDNLKIEIRNNHAGKPLLRPENIKKELNGLAFRKCSGKEARNIWLESFRRQFMRKEKNIRVLAWEKAEDVNIIYHTFPE